MQPESTWKSKEGLIRQRSMWRIDLETEAYAQEVTVGKINNDDWTALLEILPDDARKKVMMYESNHEYFARQISASASQTRPPSINTMRALMAAGLR